MKTYNERKIRARIKEINFILDEDEKTGSLADDEFKKYWQELYRLEQDLVHLYIIRHLSQTHKVAELDMSLYPYHEEESDSDMDACKERHEASCNFHKKVTACRDRG